MSGDVFDGYQQQIRTQLHALISDCSVTDSVRRVRHAASRLNGPTTWVLLAEAASHPNLVDDVRYARELLTADPSSQHRRSLRAALLNHVGRLAVAAPHIIGDGGSDVENVWGWVRGSSVHQQWDTELGMLLRPSVDHYLRVDSPHRQITSCAAEFLSWLRADLDEVVRQELLDVFAELDVTLVAAGEQPRFVLAPTPVVRLLEVLLGAVTIGVHEPGDNPYLLVTMASEMWCPPSVGDRNVITVARAITA